MAVKKPQMGVTEAYTDFAVSMKQGFVIVRLSPADMELATQNADQCSFGGRSQLRARKDRAGTVNEDNLVGQLCELAFSKYWFGSVEPYRQARWIRNQNPKVGDGGYDFPAFRFNVKGSLRRNSQRLFEAYHLLVRPAERKPWAIYVPAVADLASTDDPYVVLLGFLTDEEIPDEVDEGWHFKGAHSVPATKLHRLPPMPWVW